MASTGVEYSSSEVFRGEKGIGKETAASPEKSGYAYDAETEGRRGSISPSIKAVHDSTHRKLKPRHIQLIGIGGTIVSNPLLLAATIFIASSFYLVQVHYNN